jgi:hypothetical protein
MFQNQLEAVARDTALARILLGKISAGYVHETGPQVVAKVATKRYEHETMAEETGRLLWTIQVMSLFWGVKVSPVLGWP